MAPTTNATIITIRDAVAHVRFITDLTRLGRAGLVYQQLDQDGCVDVGDH